MSNTNQFLGIVQDGKFRPLTPEPGPMGYAELTTISMQESRPPENGRIDLTEYEGKALMVQGHGGGGWIYSARVVDEAGPTLTTVVERVFGATYPSEPEPTHQAASGLTLPQGEIKVGITVAEDMLIQARAGLHHEWAELQKLGRELTEQEKERSNNLGHAVKLIDEALVVLGVDD